MEKVLPAQNLFHSDNPNKAHSHTACPYDHRANTCNHAHLGAFPVTCFLVELRLFNFVHSFHIGGGHDRQSLYRVSFEIPGFGNYRTED